LPDRTRSDELAALTTIAAQVNCTQDLDEILSGALQTALDVIGEEAGEIFLTDEETGELILHTHQGVSETFVSDEAVLGPGECLCGLAMQSQHLTVIADIENHPARSRTGCLREGFQSCIKLPLLARGEVLGLLNIQSPEDRQFTAEDKVLLTAIGNQIGIAIANAQLIDDAERRRATLDSVMNSLVDGLILLDRHGRISYVNPCAEAMLDLPALTLVGQTLKALEQELSDRVAEPGLVNPQVQATAAETKGTPAVEVMLTAPSPRTLQLRYFPIQEAGGQNLGLGLLLRDITREKELDEMKSQLLSTVSHELRTPLASIKGFATTLLRQDVSWDEDSRHEFLCIIDQESDRLTELIGNLLDMSRVEAGTLRVEPESTDLQPIIEETAAEFQVMTHRHQIRVHLPPSLPQVQADPRRVRQVLRNLVENAVKYSPEGGAITIAAEVKESYIEIRTADQGLGIEPEHLDRIFDRFYQVDSASTRKVGGAGLGLSITKAIVEAHDGQIWAESKVGEGSTFYFTLRLGQPPQGPLQEHSHA
jgi:signal transduction histidine kinase